jgi:predicted nucleic acid-binding protein
MKYVFAPSSLFKAIKENRVELLSEASTVELARYELSNVVWKEQSLYKKLSMKEAKDLIRVIKMILEKMEIIKIECNEEQIIELSCEKKISFYDASYVYCAREKNLVLVTEDDGLRNRANSIVKVTNLENLVK